MDVFGRLPETSQCNECVLVSTDRYSKLTRALPTSTKNTTHIANLFLVQGIIPMAIAIYLPTVNGPKLFSNKNRITTPALRIGLSMKLEPICASTHLRIQYESALHNQQFPPLISYCLDSFQAHYFWALRFTRHPVRQLTIQRN